MTGFAIHRSIPLTQGRVAWVDQADYAELARFRWSADACRTGFYAKRNTGTVGIDRTSEYMHRRILGLLPGDGLVADHINGDGLDNRRTNLRVATVAGNSYNMRHRSGKTSRYKGVSWSTRRSHWVVQIRGFAGPSRYLGSFADEEDAARAYDQEAVKRFGEFARVNFPGGIAVAGAGRQAVA